MDQSVQGRSKKEEFKEGRGKEEEGRMRVANVKRNLLHSPNSAYRVRILAVKKLVVMKNVYQILDYTSLTLGVLKIKID
jgi:hypothetical protein